MPATPIAVADALLVLDRLRADLIESHNKAYSNSTATVSRTDTQALLTQLALIHTADATKYNNAKTALN